MKKREILVVDIKGEERTENDQLSRLYSIGYRLISVVSLPLCRRAYLERGVQKPTTGEDDVERARRLT